MTIVALAVVDAVEYVATPFTIAVSWLSFATKDNKKNFQNDSILHL